MEENLDHNTAMAYAIEGGDEEEVALLLGHKDRVRCGGIIRTGVKVPKQGLSTQELAKFKELEAQGMPYDEIDRALGGAPKTRTSKLYPKNADHFVIRDCDFTRPADAQFIRGNYADPDGHVRRIPVWLSVGELEKALHHGFKAFDGSGSVQAASFYEGSKLMVRYLPKGHKGRATKDDWKVAPLNPEKPVDPTGRVMQFGGIYRFHVAGLRGLDEIMIPSKSWYGFSYSVALLRRIRSILGRFDGLLGGESYLEIVKSPEEVTTPEGKKQTQWIPLLELSIDAMELARYAEGRAERGQKAAKVFNAKPAVKEAEPAPKERLSDTGPTEEEARARIHSYMTGAAKHIGVSYQQLVAWAALDETDGVSVSDLPLDQLRALANKIREEVRTNPEGFGAAVKARAEEFGVTE